MEVRVDNLRFSRGNRLVLDLPSLAIASGRVTALVGPNGSGKSTLLHLVAALETPHAGAVHLGDEPAAPNRRTRHAIAYAFQQPVFLTGTVRANLDLALRLRRLPPAERTSRIDETARACGIDHLLDRDAHRLSGGEAQRASLARALCLRAAVTLLDEPLTGLDGPVRAQLLQELPALLSRFATTTIYVTHDRDEALRLAADMVVLIDGRVSAAGEKLGLFRSPPDHATAAFLGFTVFDADSGPMALPPGALHAGAGDVEFEFLVESIVDLGVRREATGLIDGLRVTVAVPAEIPGPGARITVSAPRSAVIRWPNPESEARR